MRFSKIKIPFNTIEIKLERGVVEVLYKFNSSVVWTTETQASLTEGDTLNLAGFVGEIEAERLMAPQEIYACPCCVRSKL